jgi:hypothetical protein
VQNSGDTKTRRRFAAATIAAALSGGCVVVSLQPAYDDQSIVFEERLIGQWDNAEDRTSASIESAEWRSYKIVYTDRSTTTTFRGNLTRIEDTLFLDLTEGRGADPGPYLVPVHGVFKIDISGDTLSVSALDYGWFAHAALKHIGRLTVAMDDRRNVAITSSSGELRTWLAHAPPEAFGAALTFMRKK